MEPTSGLEPLTALAQADPAVQKAHKKNSKT
jgi:hypothetical protein